MGIILKGKVIIGRETLISNNAIIAIFGKDDYIGEVIAISHNKATNDMISGENNTEILFIPVTEVISNEYPVKRLVTILAQKTYFFKQESLLSAIKNHKGEKSANSYWRKLKKLILIPFLLTSTDKKWLNISMFQDLLYQGSSAS